MGKELGIMRTRGWNSNLENRMLEIGTWGARGWNSEFREEGSQNLMNKGKVLEFQE